jgi:hypothetical protein
MSRRDLEKVKGCAAMTLKRALTIIGGKIK